MKDTGNHLYKGDMVMKYTLEQVANDKALRKALLEDTLFFADEK